MRLRVDRSTVRNFSTSSSQEEEILTKLRVIIDPDLHQDIVTLGFVKDIKIEGSEVTFSLELTTPACPVREEFRKSAEAAVRTLPWVKKVTVTISSTKKSKPFVAPSNDGPSCPGLVNVHRIIAVSSAKGGVGKSTVAVNLAYSIARLGGRVGIFDADIHGPSLPTMVSPGTRSLRRSERSAAMIAPLEYEGVALMSYGFTAKAAKEGSAVMRGPMVSRTVHQLIGYTDWGELDYLVIDMPPGTGDIQLTLGQEVKLDGAVIVTTPQKLSFVDVIKGIDMFDTLQVPLLSVVENMLYLDCGCGERHFPFGKGHKDELVRSYGIPHAVQVPIEGVISYGSDTGRPFSLDPEKHPNLCKVYMDLASGVVQQLSKLGAKSESIPLVEWDDTKRKVIVRPAAGAPLRLSVDTLRSRCAAAQPPPPLAPGHNVFPAQVAPKGRYAVLVTWSDGHVSIFPYSLLFSLPDEP